MVAKTYGGAVFGVDAEKVTIEVSVGQGTKFWMSGLPDSAIKESAHRVESAIKMARYRMPRNKVVVNLAPADIRKEGSAYDLPIALGVLHSSEQADLSLMEEYMVMGELAFDYSQGQISDSRNQNMSFTYDEVPVMIGITKFNEINENSPNLFVGVANMLDEIIVNIQNEL